MASEAWNASAVPWKLPRTDGGNPTSRSAAWMAETASLSEAPRARLNESVTAGNWPWWAMASGVLRETKRAKASRGTCAPAGDLM